MAFKQSKVPVTARALTQRINRALASQDKMLKTARGDAQRRELGTYYTLDLKSHRLADRAVDLEQLGRKLRVLQAHERLLESAAASGNILARIRRRRAGKGTF